MKDSPVNIAVSAASAQVVEAVDSLERLHGRLHSEVCPDWKACQAVVERMTLARNALTVSMLDVLDLLDPVPGDKPRSLYTATACAPTAQPCAVQGEEG